MSRLPLGNLKEAFGKARENAQEVIPGQTNPHKPGFDYKAVPFHDYFPDCGGEHRPGAALRAQASASPYGVSGPVSGARTGKATMEISLKGFPAANTKSDGGSLLDKIEVRRGRGMQEARDQK